jgi:hypothetical protein
LAERERIAIVLDDVVRLADQGGGFIVRWVKVRHALDMGSLKPLINLV